MTTRSSFSFFALNNFAAALPDLFINVSGKATVIDFFPVLIVAMRALDFLSYSNSLLAQPEAGPPLAEKNTAASLPVLWRVFSYSLPGLPKPKIKRIIYEYYARRKKRKHGLGNHKSHHHLTSYRHPHPHMDCPAFYCCRCFY